MVGFRGEWFKDQDGFRTGLFLLGTLDGSGCQAPGTSPDTVRPPEAVAAPATGKDKSNGASPKKPLYSPGHHHH